jgi:hypothetical protein
METRIALEYDSGVLAEYTEKIGGVSWLPVMYSSVSLNIQGICIKSPVLRAAGNFRA